MGKQIKLPNNCRYSEPSVHPKGWKGTSAKLVNESWYIKYRFYDDNTGKSKQVLIRENRLSDLSQKQGFVISTLAGIKEALEAKGYNPIEKTWITPFTEPSKSLNSFTPFIDALNLAYNSLKLSELTMRDISGVIANTKTAVTELGLLHMNIGSITRKHMRAIFDKVGLLKDGTSSNDKFNRHRTYLGILYSELMEFEAIEANVPLAVKPKKKDAKKEKQLLTKSERVKMVKCLEETSPRFLLFIQIFFHSGARLTEMMRVKVKDVNFAKQTITYLVLKGKKYEYKERPMKDIAVGYWSDAIYGGKPNDYVWSIGLLPSAAEPPKYMVKMRWERLKKKLGLKVGFYSLKHLNTTETKKIIGTKGAAIQNAESEEMINRIYDVDKERDDMEIIRGVNNPL